MPCLFGCLALFFPRIVIILVVIFSDYIGDSFENQLWPFLGFLFMPLTTLAYAWAWHYGDHSVQGVEVVILILAVLIDLGLLGASERSRRRWQER